MLTEKLRLRGEIMAKTYQYIAIDSEGFYYYLSISSDKTYQEQALDFKPVGDFQIFEEHYEDNQLPTTKLITEYNSITNTFNNIKSPSYPAKSPSKVKVFYNDGLDEEMNRREFRLRFDCTGVPEGIINPESELFERYGVIKVEFIKKRTRPKKVYLTSRGSNKITYNGVEYKNKKVLQETLGISTHMLRKLLRY